MRLRNRIIVAASIFCISYLIFLIFWIRVMPYYGDVVTQISARLAASTAGFRVEKIGHGKEVTTITFARNVVTKEWSGPLLLNLNISISCYSFNVPLTFALATGLFPFLKWRKSSFIEVCFILLFIHLLYLYLFCSLQLIYPPPQVGMEAPPTAVQILVQFMWTFTNSMIMRFEPFLVAIYLWLKSTKRVEPV